MINHLLKHENKTLQTILAQINHLQQLNDLLAQHIPSEIAKYCRIVKYERNCLIVLVENGNWATQLRFQIPELLTQLRQYPILQSLNGICCKTRPGHYPAQSRKKIRSIAKMSAQTAATVLETAKMINDEKLRKIMEKIAHHGS